ncbi:MAG: hypothetical protein FWF81_06425 [Defluviitaleaceae bacterium]|nr:hypothetical protein [Defluviitaleaceae bacterium]
MDNRKLEYFAEAIEREVESRKRREKHQIANDLSRKTADAIKREEEKMDFVIETARRDVMRKSNKKIALATAKAKAAFITKQNELHAEILNDVNGDLIAFTQSEKYKDYLIEKINATKTSHNFSAVKLRPADMEFANEILQKTNLTPVQGNDDYIGGFILQNETAKLDQTFKFKLQKARTP